MENIDLIQTRVAETFYDFETLSGGFILCLAVRAELADLTELQI